MESRKCTAREKSIGAAAASGFSRPRHARHQLDGSQHLSRLEAIAHFGIVVCVLRNINALWDEAPRNFDPLGTVVNPLAALLIEASMAAERPLTNAAARRRGEHYLVHVEPGLVRFGHG